MHLHTYTINAVVWHQKWQFDWQNTNIEKKKNAFACSNKNCYFLQYFVGTSDTLSQKHIYFQVSNYICIHYTINHQCSFLSLLMVWHYNINDSMPPKHLHWENLCICERAERARKFLHFHIQKMLFLSIFCWYFRNFVGTSVQMTYTCRLTCTDRFPYVPTNSEKALLGCPPAPPPLWLR